MSLAIDHHSWLSAEATGLKAARRELPNPKSETHQLNALINPTALGLGSGLQ